MPPIIILWDRGRLDGLVLFIRRGMVLFNGQIYRLTAARGQFLAQGGILYTLGQTDGLAGFLLAYRTPYTFINTQM